MYKKNKRITDIILFGSRAKGNYQNGSDIDIAVVAEHLTLDDLLQIKADVDGLNMPYKIDIVDYKKIKNKELLDHIKRVGKHLN